MKVLTLPRMTALQIGHSLKLRAHSPQATRWPQGTNTTDTSLSMHTLHVLSSCRRRSCSSVLIRDSSLPKKEKKAQTVNIITAPECQSCHLRKPHCNLLIILFRDWLWRWQKYLSGKFNLNWKTTTIIRLWLIYTTISLSTHAGLSRDRNQHVFSAICKLSR